MKKCYEENEEYIMNVVKKNNRDANIMFSAFVAVSTILYLLFPKVEFFSGLFLFMIIFNIFMLLLGIGVSIFLDIDRKKYSFIKKVCIGDEAFEVLFKSNFEVIHFKDIIYLLPPKNRIGEIGYVLKKGKKRIHKDLMLSPELFDKASKTIIQYFKKTKERPPFLVVLPDERAAMRNTLAWMQTYAVQNKKEKLDKILNNFWSKHKLEEFE